MPPMDVHVSPLYYYSHVSRFYVRPYLLACSDRPIV